MFRLENTIRDFLSESVAPNLTIQELHINNKCKKRKNANIIHSKKVVE